MNILIVTYFFPQRNSIASLRPYSWAKYWTQLGHNITVLTVHKEPDQSDLHFDCKAFEIISLENSFDQQLRKTAKEREFSSNKTSFSLKSIIIDKLKKFIQKRGLMSGARMPDLTDFIVQKSFEKVKERNFDLVISTAGPYSEHLIAKRIKDQMPKTFWIADYRDLWTQNHIYKGLFPFTLIEEYLEYRINHSADMITTVSEPLAKQIKDKYNIAKVEVIENGFDFDDMQQLPKEPFWNDDKIRLVYTGSIYKGKQDPSPLFQAIIKILQSEERELLKKLEVLFVGGSMVGLNELIDGYGIESYVKNGGFVTREDSLRMQRDASALIFLEFEALGIDGILTGKLFEYIASGTQIIGIGVTEESQPGKLIAQSGHGINFGKDSEKIKEYLISLLQNAQRNSIQNNFAIIEKYSRKAQAERILELFYSYRALE